VRSWTPVTESEIYTVLGRFEGPVPAHVHGREVKKDQMVLQTFQKAT